MKKLDDVFTWALKGTSQIEASAGTGKTWSLCALYARLLLEKKLRVDQILVVTFTKAATAELHERIRNRLMQILYVVEARIAASHAKDDDAWGDDLFINRLFATTLDGYGHDDLEAVARQLRVALRGFDQAAIHTIHAFCQRALQEAPFASALPFSSVLVPDDAALRFELAADFWREQVEPAAARYAGFAAWLVENKAVPDVLDKQLKRRLAKPLAQLRWHGLDDVEEDPGLDARAQALFDQAYAMWLAERGKIREKLDEARVSSVKSNMYSPEIIDKAIFAWDEWFSHGDVNAPWSGDASKYAPKLSASELARATKVRCKTPEHEFFNLADALIITAAAISAQHQKRWLSLMRAWLDHAPGELARRKQERREMSYDDLLARLYHALIQHPGLAGTLRERYAAALIDEFQDTDPLQFDIFQRLFAQHGPLFLIGDPKQAIYSFRGADLHTYLAARHNASAHYTLGVNQRSTPPMIAACNKLFGANPHAFVIDSLAYHAVQASDRARAEFVDETSAPGSFVVWTLPGMDGNASDILRKQDAQRAASDACAAEIVRLLRGARQGRVMIGKDPLAPADIAVLVQSHKLGKLVKDALTDWGVGSVELSKLSVFATQDAEQIEYLLMAINAPGDRRCLRAALAIDWFGLDAQALWRSAQTDTGYDPDGPDSEARWIERFSHYRMLWHEHGFAMMWRTLTDELRVAPWLAAQRDGERRLTDINHLAELLQAQDVARPGIAPTLRWFATQRRVKDDRDEVQLRLESDRNLVQIVTIHKSKGLEYKVVFCPFINDGDLRANPVTIFDPREYHDDEGHTVLHYGLAEKRGNDAHDDNELTQHVKRLAKREQAAERVRLLYVALTRAVYRCYVVAGPYLARDSKEDSQKPPKLTQSQYSMLNWVIAGREHSIDQWLAGKRPDITADLAECWREFAGGPVSMMPLPLDLPVKRLGSAAIAPGAFSARIAHRALQATWQLTSFSAMTASIDLAHRHAGDARPDHDATADIATSDPMTGEHEPIMPNDILNFPRGMAAGDCLHRLFELANFADRESWPAAIERALRERPVSADAQHAPQLGAMMHRLLADVSAIELAPQAAPGMTLASLDPQRRLTELEFLFSAPALDGTALRRVLRAHGYPDMMLEAGVLHGFVKGFIDRVFEHDGRYWIIDWKSNYLGHRAADYDAPSLEHAMTAHTYHLQALLYMVALHRYLRARVPDYDYDAHCGGYLYLFVRGVRPDWQAAGGAAGIHARRPARALIDALDQLMNGGAA